MEKFRRGVFALISVGLAVAILGVMWTYILAIYTLVSSVFTVLGSGVGYVG